MEIGTGMAGLLKATHVEENFNPVRAPRLGRRGGAVTGRAMLVPPGMRVPTVIHPT